MVISHSVSLCFCSVASFSKTVGLFSCFVGLSFGSGRVISHSVSLCFCSVASFSRTVGLFSCSVGLSFCFGNLFFHSARQKYNGGAPCFTSEINDLQIGVVIIRGGRLNRVTHFLFRCFLFRSMSGKSRSAPGTHYS